MAELKLTFGIILAEGKRVDVAQAFESIGYSEVAHVACAYTKGAELGLRSP